MQPTLNPWLVSYISQYHQTKSRYEIDRYLIEVGYEPQDIEAVWQSLKPSSKEETRKASQKWLNRLIASAPPVLVLFFMIIIIFDPVLPVLNSPHTKIKSDTIPTAKLSPDGKLLAVRTDKIEIWNIADRKMLHTFGITMYNGFWWSSDNQYIALNPAKGTVQIWRVSTGKLVHTLAGPLGENSYGFGFGTEFLFNPNTNSLEWVYSYESRASADTLVKSLNIPSSMKDDISTIAGGFNKEILAVGFGNGTIQLWRVSDNKLLASFYSNDEGIRELVFSPDGQFLASTNNHRNEEGASIANDKSIKLWRMSDGALIKKFEGHSRLVYDLFFSADGQTLISTSEDNTLRFWPVR